jgi:2-iminobutanoate/2-iminopropanoate deaminase
LAASSGTPPTIAAQPNCLSPLAKPKTMGDNLTSASQRDAFVEYLPGAERQATRSYSPAIITRGGRTVYLAGQTALQDLAGSTLANDFDGQTRTIFALLDQTLRQAGGSLKDLVTMTVFINDPRHGDRFVELRKEFFEQGRYPCSALITVSNFARPGMLIEIQGIAVLAD